MSVAFKMFRYFNQVSSRLSPSWSAKFAMKIFMAPRRFKPKAWELSNEQSAKRFSFSENISALRWHPEAGKNNGKKVILVHGWEGRATQMSAFAPSLVDQGYEVIAVDLPGHGHSEGTKSDIVEFAETIKEFDKKEGPFDTVIAHSMGGAGASWAIYEGMPVNNLVLIAAPSRMDLILKHFTGFMGFSKKASETFIDMMGRQFIRHPKEVDTTIFLKGYENRLLIIHDADDREIPPNQAERLAETKQQAKLHMTTNLGHRRILQSDEVINHTIDFMISEPVRSEIKNSAG